MSGATTTHLLGTYCVRMLEQARDLAAAGRKAGFTVSGPTWKEFNTPTVSGYGYEVKIAAPKSDTTRARSTGTHVTLERGDDLPWMLICEEHSGCMEFETKRAALSARSAPDTWCEWCMGNEIEVAS